MLSCDSVGKWKTADKTKMLEQMLRRDTIVMGELARVIKELLEVGELHYEGPYS